MGGGGGADGGGDWVLGFAGRDGGRWVGWADICQKLRQPHERRARVDGRSGEKLSFGGDHQHLRYASASQATLVALRLKTHLAQGGGYRALVREYRALCWPGSPEPTMTSR